MPRSAPLEVFYSYAHEDEKLRDELEKHLKQLQRSGLISDWHDRRIEPGREWASEIDSHVNSADIILLLVSADFISSDYCYGVEMKVALVRHGLHEAVVIPVILRPVLWDSAPFARIQALPRDGKPITSWPDRDEAFAEVARGIRDIVLRYTSAPPSGATTVFHAPLIRSVPKDRVLDAAIPSRVVKGQATELLAKIRLPGSPGLVGTLLEDEEAEARPEDVRSTGFDVVFPIEPDGRPGDLRVEITLTSPDFHPDKQTKVMFVPPDDDSDTCYFLLTPVRMGQLKVLIELRWEEALRGSRRLRTECVATAESIPARSGMSVVQMKLGAGLEKGDEITRPIAVILKDSDPDTAFMRRLNEPVEAERARREEAERARKALEEAREAAEKARWETEEQVMYARRTSEEWERANRSLPSATVSTYEEKRSAARPRWLIPIAVAVIGAISSITIGYWQWHQKPTSTAVVPPNSKAITNSESKSPIKARDEANRGWWYETGQIGQIDGKPDYQAAMRWYLKAVDDGDVIANWNVGRLYEFGFGVPIDLDKAKAWYQKGADKGDMNAQDYLVNLGHNRKY